MTQRGVSLLVVVVVVVFPLVDTEAPKYFGHQESYVLSRPFELSEISSFIHAVFKNVQ